MTTVTTSKSYNAVTNGDLTFSGINVVETDTFVNASVAPLQFTANSQDPTAVSSGSEAGFWFSNFTMLTTSDGTPTSEVLNFTYNISVTDPTQMITGIDSLYLADANVPDGLFVAVENIYDSSNNLLGTQTYSSSAPNPPPTTLIAGVQTAHVTWQISTTATLAGARIDASIAAQLFIQSAAPQLAALGDYVWFDANNDGLQDNGETGVGGVTVDLMSSTNTVLATTTTDANGHYLFTNLAAGTYSVLFIPAPGSYHFTTATVGADTTIDSNANTTTGQTAPVTLAAGQTDLTIDAGLVTNAQLPTYALGDYVWFDTNGDGKQAASELGVSGVSVSLLDGTGAPLGQTTTTNGSGFYSFTNLPAGTYEVKFTAPSGDTFTTQNAGGTTTANDSNPNASTGVTGQVTLGALNPTDNTIDAGLVALPAALGDYVWFDTNGDGKQASTELGVPGVTVTLLDGSGAPLGPTTTTDSSGFYHFTNLAAGTYEVKFTAPSGDSRLHHADRGAGSTTADRLELEHHDGRDRANRAGRRSDGQHHRRGAGRDSSPRHGRSGRLCMVRHQRRRQAGLHGAGRAGRDGHAAERVRCSAWADDDHRHIRLLSFHQPGGGHL